MKKEVWWDRTIQNVEQAKGYIRGYGEGVFFPSRMKVLDLIKDGESLLDVGCGPGCEYENIKESKRKIVYKGVDYSLKMIQACRELFPETDWAVQDARILMEDDKSFDTVLLRHVLEFIYPYSVPIGEAWRVAKKRVILVFWIPPQNKGADRISFNEDDDKCQANAYDLPTLMAYLKTLTDKIQVWENVGKSNMVILLEK